MVLPVGPTKVNARQLILFTEGTPEVKIIGKCPTVSSCLQQNETGNADL